MTKRNIAWHFVGKTLRDGSPIPEDGEWLVHRGLIQLCQSGLHWSREPFDALQYARGSTLCLVEVGGTSIEPDYDNKGVSTKRKIIARMDATEMLRYFARMQALSVIHLWDAPDVVLDYLMTGDEANAVYHSSSLMTTARYYVAWDATRSLAMDSAWDAARNAVRDAAKDAARSVARSDAWDDARNAAWDAAWDAARDAFNELVSECFDDFLED